MTASEIKPASYFEDHGLPRSEYYKQFKSAVPELHGIYKQAKGTWEELTYKIIYVGEGVALGVCISTKEMGNFAVGKKSLFVANGSYLDGWKYEDNRPTYRLQTA